MKKIVMFAVAVMLLSACGGKGDGSTEKKGSDWSLDSITDSLSFKVGEQEILSQVDIVYPKNVESVKNDLMEFVKTLGQGDEFNGYPDSVKIDTTDMVSLVKYLVKSKAELLKADFVDGEPTEIPLDY